MSSPERPSDDWFAQCDRYLVGELSATHEAAFIETLADPVHADAFADVVIVLDAAAPRPAGAPRSRLRVAVVSLAVAASLLVAVGWFAVGRHGEQPDRLAGVGRNEAQLAEADFDQPTLVWIERAEVNRWDDQERPASLITADSDGDSNLTDGDPQQPELETPDWMASAMSLELGQDDLL